MSKGKSKGRLGRRPGSDSNNHSRASASDQRHDQERMQEDKSLKPGSVNTGKMKEEAGGRKRST